MTTYHNNHYNRELKLFARELRTQSKSKAEKRIWKRLLSRKQTGVRFLRQRPIDKFVVDFFAPELKLIIEIDGSSHGFKGASDSLREMKLLNLGYAIIRFPEGMVLSRLDVVEREIVYAIHCVRNK